MQTGSHLQRTSLLPVRLHVIFKFFYDCDFHNSSIFREVECYDTVEGAQCGNCPSGYTGDGRNCALINACQSDPCPTGIISFLFQHEKIQNQHIFMYKIFHSNTLTSFSNIIIHYPLFIC